MSEHQLDPVTQRLDRLERENWYWKRATILLLIFISLTLLMGQGSVTPRMIEAERFVLKDINGKIRGVLGAADTYRSPSDHVFTSGDYGLHLYDADGRYLAGLYYEDRFIGGGQIESVGKLELRGKNTPTSATLHVSDGLALLRLDSTEQPREIAERESSEWTEKYNMAKTPEEKERLRNTIPFPFNPDYS